MKITFYTPKFQYNNVKQPQIRLTPPLKHDTVCFKSRDFLDLPEKEILKQIKDSVVPQNFLGQGTEAEVYRIKDTDYCVRIPYIAQDFYQSRFSKELTPVDKVNHTVAKLGYGATVMKYFDGEIPKWHMHNNHERYKFQEKIAEMPTKSYSDFLHQIANAIDNEMLFDFSGGNLIVNTEKQKLTAIDFFGISDNPRPIRPLMEMYSTLTCYGSLEKTGKKIFDKIVDAGLEEFKPNKTPCMDTALFDFLELSLKRMGDAYTPDCEKIKYEIMYNADKLKKLKKAEIIDKTVSKLLEQQLNSFKALLNKVH